MKTLPITTAENATTSHNRVRLVLTLAGIVTAVLCSLALLRDIRSAELLDAKAPRILETSRIVAVNLVGEVNAWL